MLGDLSCLSLRVAFHGADGITELTEETSMGVDLEIIPTPVTVR
jgi:hypothetical protein